MPKRLRLFPLNAVLFPGTPLNLHVFEPRYKQLIGECIDAGEAFGVVLIRDGQEAGDPSVQPHDVGSIAEIVEVTRLPFGRFYISTMGRDRFRISEIISREPYLTVEVELIGEDRAEDGDVESLAGDVRAAFLEYLDVVVQFSGQESALDLPGDPQRMSYVVGDALQVADSMKQRLLELDSTVQRLTVELSFLRRLLPQLHKLLERRNAELEARPLEDDGVRAEHEKFFGKYFSAN
ncbi:MAG: LON peptidase substrate-binding domain-containing protein [Candidatus Eremiobacteraeota bacterium]|nr:LON peptidase substrate-binding domain-containing protein [Candidatus Eremiobacteraeota bacterium]